MMASYDVTPKESAISVIHVEETEVSLAQLDSSIIDGRHVEESGRLAR